MRPELGWAGLSRSALKKAEAQLLADSEGVRDEVGVLALHTAYANRFFPGTSVQQTRLRYALFVPWQIMALLGDRKRVQSGHARRKLEEAELALAGRLPDIDGEGTIGRRMAKANRSVAIPPSQSYWVALGAWGILHTGSDGNAPSRTTLFARWGSWSEGHRGRPATDDEGRMLETARHLFHQGLPKPPAGFPRDDPLDFKLLSRERNFLRTRLLDTRRPGDGQPSFLSALVGSGLRIQGEQYPWSESIACHADKADQQALHRARDAAALAAVTRAVYAAAVECRREKDGSSSVGETHRNHLAGIVDQHGDAAQRLRLSDLCHDSVFIENDLKQVLTTIQHWLSRDTRNPLEKAVIDALSLWELRRKGSRRAKLPLSGHGREARASWRADETTLAGPIGYRWNLVRRFLRDLQKEE